MYEVNMFSKISNGQAKKIDNGISGKAPLDAVNRIARSMPGLWKVIEKKYFEVVEFNKAHYSYSFLSHKDWVNVFSNFPCFGNWYKYGFREMDTIISFVATHCAWRYTQSVYKFDADFVEQLNKSIPEKIPSVALSRLPELSMYIEVSVMRVSEFTIKGFWISQIVDNNNDMMISIVLHPCEVNSNSSGIIRFNASQDIDTCEFCTGTQSLLSMLYYLCTEQPEIENVREPEKQLVRDIVPLSTRHGYRLFAPDKTSNWIVGKQIGNDVRQYQMQSSLTKTKGSWKGKRPHMRRGHFHSYWVGKRNGERTLISKWLPPIFTRAVIHEPQAADNYYDNELLAA